MAHKVMSKEDRAKKEEEYHKSVAELFIKAINENTAPWRKPWQPNISMLDHNMFTMRNQKEQKTWYKGMNGLICEMVRFNMGSDDPRWFTMGELIKYNESVKDEKDKIYVRKGQKATFIEFFEKKFYDKDHHEIKRDEEGNLLTKEIAFSKTILKNYAIFNASQTGKYIFDENGKPKKDDEGNFLYTTGFEPVKIDEKNKKNFEPIVEPEKIVSATKVNVKHDQVDQCYYTERDDSIHLVIPERFESSKSYYATLLHELTHWTGVPKRLDREEFRKYHTSKEWRAKEELVAEIGSYMLSKEANIYYEPTQENNAYVQSWCNFIKEKPEAIFEACKKAKEASNYILDFQNVNKNKEKLLENESEIEITVTKKKGR